VKAALWPKIFRSQQARKSHSDFKLQDKIHASLFASVLGFLLGVSAFHQLWGAFFSIVVYLGIFAFFISYPQIKDLWQQKLQSQREPVHL
jgi:hypothetical protein